MGDNYGTLSSDYDAGYDDGLAFAYGQVQLLLSGKEWGPDTLEDLSTLLSSNGFKIAEPGEKTNRELANEASSAYEVEHGLASMPDEVAAALDRLRGLDDA